MAIHYAWEKFYTAVYTAASSEKPLQQRLAEACVYNVIHVKEVDVPPPTWERIQKLMKAVTERGGAEGEGSINATTSAMSDDQAKKWLVEICGIFTEIAEAHYKKS